MSHSLLPPRGIFVPTHIIFHSQLPSAVRLTWIQLRCLAWEGWRTHPLSLPELASLIGIHPNRLCRHLSQLQSIQALSWRKAQDEKITISFPEEPLARPKHPIKSPLPAIGVNISRPEELSSASYFPSRILGYISYDEDVEILPPLEIARKSMGKNHPSVKEFLKTQPCVLDQLT